MILELMQHRYLSESADELGALLRRSRDEAQRNDPQIITLLGHLQLEPQDLGIALSRIEEAASELSKPVAREATAFPRDPVSAQMQSLLQRYFIDQKLV